MVSPTSRRTGPVLRDPLSRFSVVCQDPVSGASIWSRSPFSKSQLGFRRWRTYPIPASSRVVSSPHLGQRYSFALAVDVRTTHLRPRRQLERVVPMPTSYHQRAPLTRRPPSVRWGVLSAGRVTGQMHRLDMSRRSFDDLRAKWWPTWLSLRDGLDHAGRLRVSQRRYLQDRGARTEPSIEPSGRGAVCPRRPRHQTTICPPCACEVAVLTGPPSAAGLLLTPRRSLALRLGTGACGKTAVAGV